MVNFSPILLVIGILLTVLSGAMVIPAIVDFYAHATEWQGFVISAFITCFVGIALILLNRRQHEDLSIKQAFLLTTFSWITLVAFAALPFIFSSLQLSVTDAFFESMSGLTTTGATIMSGLDEAPPGILLWRALLQWLGGVGIIVLAMAVLPMLKVGGMQLFRTESSDKSDKILPRATQLSGAIGSVYILFTILCTIALWMAGMTFFDAICHAMTTIATSGFSTHDASIGYFDSRKIETIIIIFMIMSGIPYVLYIQFLRGKTTLLWRDPQVQWYLSFVVISVIAVTGWLISFSNFSPDEAFRQASFNVVAILTTTGFTSADYYTWGSFVIIMMFMLPVVGGCTGSTSGGMKIFRYQVLFQTAKAQIQSLVQPHGVFMPQFNKRPISEHITSSVLTFFILFSLCFTIIAILLSLTGLDFITCMSAAVSAMANLGPGLGDIIGPSGNYSPLSDAAKWIISIGMLIGRLEIFTVLILFSAYFWKN